MIKKIILLILITIALTSSLFLKLGFSRGWFVSYLSVNKPVSPELLIVEGWVSASTIHLAAMEFNDKAYSRVLTSGSPTDPFYLLSENGHLEFSFMDQPLRLQQNDSISFILKGSPVQGTYPEYMISVNDQAFSKGFVSEKRLSYSLILDSAFSAQKIGIYFLNDTFYMGEDRNLQVKYLHVNGREYPARSNNVLHYDKKDQQGRKAKATNFGSVAEICAHELQKEGIPDHLIEAIPSHVSDKNRTLASAIVLSSYLDGQDIPFTGVNIISEGIHARRTWISYKFALREQTNTVGIICIPSTQNHHSGMQPYSKKEILRELTSIVYYKLFFNKARYRKQLIQHHS